MESNNAHVSITIPSSSFGNEVPKLLKDSAGSDSCCIFRVPRHVNIKTNHCQPQILSIGPYHHGSPNVKMIEEHKQRLVNIILPKTEEVKVSLISQLVNAIVPKTETICECYSEYFTLENDGRRDGEKLIEMMVSDGCFIIALFLIVGKKINYNTQNDPIFSMGWILPSLTQDLLKLENQIPFFVLEDLYEIIKPAFEDQNLPSFTDLAIAFFNTAFRISQIVLKKRSGTAKEKHLLDLVRLGILPVTGDTPPQTPAESDQQHFRRGFFGEKLHLAATALYSTLAKDKGNIVENREVTQTLTHHFLTLIPSAQKLRLHGIAIKLKENTDGLLDIEFINGKLLVPRVVINEFIISVFVNCVAFEQSNCGCANQITSYIAFMGCLINTPGDVGLLSERGIIENYYAADKDVYQFFNCIWKDGIFNIENNYLSGVFEEVNKYCMYKRYTYWADFKLKSFATPVTVLSSLTAIFLFIVTFFQFYMAIRPSG